MVTKKFIKYIFRTYNNFKFLKSNFLLYKILLSISECIYICIDILKSENELSESEKFKIRKKL